jgi:hypothetical protein
MNSISEDTFKWIVSAFIPIFLTLIGWFHGRISELENQRLTTISALAELNVKVTTMWDFQMRRAMSEVVNSGVGKMNSPITFKPEVIKQLDPIKPQLIIFGEKVKDLNDIEATLRIEKEFGKQLVDLVCIPFGLTHGACLIAALMVARQQNEIEITL